MGDPAPVDQSVKSVKSVGNWFWHAEYMPDQVLSLRPQFEQNNASGSNPGRFPAPDPLFCR
jgi:hypothetical protein